MLSTKSVFSEGKKQTNKHTKKNIISGMNFMEHEGASWMFIQ